jgi:hypothetical protein
MLSTGYLFAEKPDDRAGYIADMYFLAVESGIRDGHIEPEDWLKFARFSLHQAVIGEQMFGTTPDKASELLEHILGFVEPQGGHIGAELIAERQDHYADVISQILGDKELGQAVIGDYLVAQDRMREGIMPPPILGTEQLKRALLEEGMEAQSFLYDFNGDNLIYEGDDPEFWHEGYGIPEAYDPKDPFNPYYPWVEDISTQQLNAEEWLRFGPGEWTWDKEKYEFHCIPATAADGGYYRNDFTKTEYVFMADFRVDGPEQAVAGIVFRYVDEKNYMKFSVFGGTNSTLNMVLHKVTNGIESMMGLPMNPFNWVKGAWSRVEVSVLDSRIKIKVNGRLQYDLVD